MLDKFLECFHFRWRAQGMMMRFFGDSHDQDFDCRQSMPKMPQYAYIIATSRAPSFADDGDSDEILQCPL